MSASSHTSTSLSNRLSDVLRQCADRCQSAVRRKRSRTTEEAKECLVRLAPLVLDTQSNREAASIHNKRMKTAKEALKSKVEKPATGSEGDKAAAEAADLKTSRAASERDNEQLEFYKKKLEEHNSDLQQIDGNKKKLEQELVDLWGAYRYGLTKIGGLTELGHAPDAIMPGNF